MASEATKTEAFTPGPWTPVSGHGVHYRDCYIRAGERHDDGAWPAVAKCCSSRIGGLIAVQANARLIAAAPDGFAVITAMVEAFGLRRTLPLGFPPELATAAMAYLDKVNGRGA